MALDVSMAGQQADARSRAVWLTLSLCFVAAMLEGFIFQSIGVAASRLVREFHLSAGGIGWIASATTLALLPGAILGGELADRIGRPRVLAGAVTLFGLFTLATTAAGGARWLLAMRGLAGLGLGAALPNLIALCAEAGEAQSRSRLLALMYCGVPVGGAMASLISTAGGGASDWRLIFFVGGALALLVAPVMFVALPESARFQAQRAATRQLSGAAAGRNRSWQVLFGAGRAPTTLLLWMALFIEMLLIYVLVNWMPVLLIGRGFSPVQAGRIQIVFNIGGVAGILVYGWLMDRSSRRATALTMYGCVIAALAALAGVHGFSTTALVALCVGVFAVGGQMVLHSIVPTYYPTMMRSSGVGWGLAMGRLGSIAGPVLAGELLQAGLSPTRLLAAGVPVLGVAALGVLGLLSRPQASD